MNSEWKFDQGKNVAAITSVHITKEHKPILLVSHYSDDHSWAFLSGDNLTEEDSQVVSMQAIVEIDSTVLEIATLEPGWSAQRNAVGEAWVQYKDNSI